VSAIDLTGIPPLKLRILALIRRAGPDGIDGGDLFSLVYADGYRPDGKGIREERKRTALKAHINQINKKIRSSGWQIAASKCAGGWYRLQKV
jgi:hypothetical protein